MIAAHAVLTDGRAIDTIGTPEDVDTWLDELRSIDMVLDLDVHELTEAEVNAMGPVYDGPCTDGEEGA